MTENQIQLACVGILGRLCPWACCNHSPNEGKRTVGQKVHLIRMGMLPGYPDLEILAGGKSFFVEFKRGKKGRLSEEQKAFQEWALENGFPYAVCRGVQEFEDILNEWGFIRKNQLGVVHMVTYGEFSLGLATNLGRKK